MPPDDPDHVLHAAFTAIGQAVASFSVALMDYVSDLDPCDREFAEGLLMPLLHVTRTKANRLLDRASDLTARPAVLAALAEGRIDEGKAIMILDQLSVLSVAHALIAEEALLEHASKNNYTATQRYAVRFIHRLDPTAADRRHQEKRKQRMVEKIPLDDGMCLLRLMMTAHDAALAFDHVDRIARSLPKNDRTLDQKRSDVARDLLLGLDTPAPQGKTMVYLTMPVTAVLGLTDDPGMLAGYGPIPAPVARDIAAGGIWKRVLTDPVTGVAEEISGTYRPTAQQRELIGLRYPTCTAIGCNQPAHRSDLDHCRPYDGSNTTLANLRPKCRHHHRMKTHSNWRCENLPDGTHAWTTPRGKTYVTEPVPIADPAPF
ncbi:HNH endonuclease signature motif containing protein [Allokutzneria sp. NRRL B-24872]|uniref:HNH endonuclease signature motif containing protein n=1 Tax=Allokutzneria sp. NRRL B-24872 TaxID=1137961 RepID=UPI000A3B91D0|nr:HNH endonuclease signature motif containing protein [Allokutzneria sp. NRRL B-24872]